MMVVVVVLIIIMQNILKICCHRVPWEESWCSAEFFLSSGHRVHFVPCVRGQGEPSVEDDGDKYLSGISDRVFYFCHHHRQACHDQ